MSHLMWKTNTWYIVIILFCYFFINNIIVFCAPVRVLLLYIIMIFFFKSKTIYIMITPVRNCNILYYIRPVKSMWKSKLSTIILYMTLKMTKRLNPLNRFNMLSYVYYNNNCCYRHLLLLSTKVFKISKKII